MDNLFLIADEYIIASDKGLYYWGPLAYNGLLCLTDERLYFEPSGTVDKMAGAKEISIFIDNIDFVDFKGSDKIISIQAGNKMHRFSGRGAERIIKRLQLRREAFSPGNFQSPKQMKIYSEIVLFQGDTTINTTQKSAIEGQFFITKQDIRIENRNHDSIFEFSINDMKGLQFNLLTKTLVLLFPQQQFQLKGNLIPKAFLLLHTIQKAGFRNLIFCETATFFQGVLGIKGLLQSATNQLLFCPTESIDSLANAYLVTFELNEALSLKLKKWPEKRIVLETSTEKHHFSAPDIEKLYKNLAGFLQRSVPTNDRTVSNDNQSTETTSDETIHNKLEALEIQLMQDENPLLFSWGLKKQAEFEFVCGWFFLTNLRVIFCSADKTTTWIAKSAQLSKTPGENTGLGISYNKNQLLFLPADDIHFINLFWRKIKLLKPPADLRGARTGQTVQNILGKHPLVVVVKEQQEIYHLPNANLKQTPKGLVLLFSEKQQNHLQEGDVVQIEVPKKQGRFRIASVIKEIQFASPAKNNQFYMLMEDPTNVLVYNKRKAFRLLISQTLVLAIYKFNGEKFPDLNEQQKQNVTQENLQFVGKQKVELVDISFGGCKVQVEKPLLAMKIPTREILLRFQLLTKNHRISIQGIIQHTKHQKKPEENFIYGIKFVGLSETTQKTLFAEILRLEREVLRQQEEFLDVDKSQSSTT